MPLPPYVRGRVRHLVDYERAVEQSQDLPPERFLSTQTNSIRGTATTGAPTGPDDNKVGDQEKTTKTSCSGSSMIDMNGVVAIVGVIALGALLMRS